MAAPAEVIQIMGRLGIKGVSRIRCKIVEGHDKDKILTRNVVGPIRIGDVILLKETSMDAEGRFNKRK